MSAQLNLDGLSLKLTRKIARDLYIKINKALEALGGEWQRKAQAHVFKSDVRPALKALLESGTVLSDADYGFFETPPKLAAELVSWADVRPDHLALEPSAGFGRIVDALLEAGARVRIFERHPERRRHLDTRYARDHAVAIGLNDDFMACQFSPAFDRVVMNPPFERQADIDHVLHAWRCVKPGGRLVSIMAAGTLFRQDRKAKEFRAFLESEPAKSTATGNPGDAFKASGTLVRTITVVIDKAE